LTHVAWLCMMPCDNSPAYMRELLARRQGWLPPSQEVFRQPQDVPGGVEITVEDQPTAGAAVDAVREGELLPMATPTAILTRVRGVHGDVLTTGPCCLVRKHIRELRTRRVSDALGEAMVVQHPVDRQILNRYQITGLHDATALLVRKIAPSPGDALMHA